MVHPIIRALVYMLIGTFSEVFFTAISGLVESGDLSLQGHTQLWVMPLYGLGGLFLLEPFLSKMGKFNFFFRFIIYGAGILLIEFVAGFLIEKITGRIAWGEYKGVLSLRYANLTYFPAWGFLGLILEKAYRYMVRL